MDTFLRIQKSGSTSLKVAGANARVKTHPHAYCYPIGKVRGWEWNTEFPKFNLSKNDNYLALVRNPFDILVSYYHHTHRGSGGIDGWGNCNKVHGFGSWGEFLEAYIDPGHDWHLPPVKRSMFSFAYDRGDVLIIDDYFKLEEPARLNKFLTERGGAKLPRKNVTKDKPSDGVYYNPHVVSELNRIWSRDLKHFDYGYNLT